MVGGGGELVVRYGTSMVRRVMVIAALGGELRAKKSYDDDSLTDDSVKQLAKAERTFLS